MQTPSSKVLGQRPSVVAAVGCSMLVIAAIALWQLHLRSDVVDTTQLKIFYYLYLFQDYPAALLSMAVLLIGLVPEIQRAGASLAREMGDRPGLTAGLTLAALAAGSLWVYHAYPLCMDEYAPYLQSKIFAAGKLTGQLPMDLLDWLVLPGFQKMFVPTSHATGQVASIYLPGFALLLTPFMALGVPWLANPVVGALSVFAVHRLTKELTGSPLAAGTAVLLSLASPAFTINAISFYSMSAHLLCNVVFVLLLLEPTPRRALAAGLVGGLALTLHNPVPHALLAAPWLLWLLTRPKGLPLAMLAGVGYLPWVVFGWYGWQQLVDGLISVPTAVAASPVGPITTLLAGVKMLVLPSKGLVTVRVIGLSKVWLWAVPGLAVGSCIGFWRHRADVRYRLLLLSAVLTFVGYLFVPFDQGHGWGFRYFHSAWFVLPVFAAAALVRSVAAPTAIEVGSGSAVVGYLSGVALVSMFVMTGYFAWRAHGFIADHLAQLPEVKHGQPRVLFVDPTYGYYAQDLIQNDPFLREPRVIMLAHGNQEDERVIARHFPGLVRLGGDYRGTVWGLPDPSATSVHSAVRSR